MNNAVSVTPGHQAGTGVGTANVVSLCHWYHVPVPLFVESIKFAHKSLPERHIYIEARDQTEAAKWLAVNWLAMFKNANWFVFVMSIGCFVMVMTNFIMNVAAIAISLPVALVIAPYLGVAPEVIFYACLVSRYLIS